MLLSAEQVLLQSPNATVLTVDFFDTLITRSLAQPTHVFAVMEEELVRSLGREWAGFAVRRIFAEHTAREIAASDNPMRDITIDEIYLAYAQAHGVSMQQRVDLIEREKACEIAHARPVAFGAELVRIARERGMRVLVVSDNYMPATHIVNMAHAAGYSWLSTDEVMVSCEHNGMKHNGELWNAVIAQHSLNVADVLHVGDDELADGVMPASFGIRTHIQDAMRRSHRAMLNSAPAVLPLSRIEAHLRDKYANSEWPVGEVMGAGAIALLVVAQIVDVMNVLQSRDVQSIHFVARDGYLAHQVWEKLRANGIDLPPATYTSLSRSVIWRSGITSVNEEVARRLVGDDEVLNAERLSRRVGCTLESSAKAGELLDAHDSRALLIANRTRIVAASAQLREKFLVYLRSVSLLDAGHHIIADLGWSGSTIATIAELLHDVTDGATTIEGRLLGLFWDAVSNRPRVALNGYATDDMAPVEDHLRLLGCQSLFETLMSAPHGSVSGYTNDCTVQYITSEIENASYEHAGRTIAEAAIDSAVLILLGQHPSGVTKDDVTGDVAWATMMQLGHTPTPAEADFLSPVRHLTTLDHEGEGELLVSPPPPADLPYVELVDAYDETMRQSWMQGSLVAWAENSSVRWISDEIRSTWPAFQKQWVRVP